jgi:hypothetical protein
MRDESGPPNWKATGVLRSSRTGLSHQTLRDEASMNLFNLAAGLPFAAIAQASVASPTAA